MTNRELQALHELLGKFAVEKGLKHKQWKEVIDVQRTVFWTWDKKIRKQ